MSYISKFGYVVNKESLSNEEIAKIKHELRGRPLQDERYSFNKDISFPLYVETRNKFYLPKMYAISRFGQVQVEKENYLGKQWEHQIDFNGQLYDYQQEPCDILLENLKNNGGGIMSLSTGFGKTICCLYVLSQLKSKALIIVNKISLLKQWESEINKFLPEARVGILQGQKKVDVNNKDIILAMLQSLSRVDYPQEIFEDIRVTVVDEVHVIAAPIFSKVLMKTCSKYTIGLSATPTRSDGCEYVFQWFIGDIVYKTKTERAGLYPIIETIKINSSEYKQVVIMNKATEKEQIQYSSTLNELTDMSKRNQLIVELIKNFCAEKRKILVLSDRRDHLKLLQSMLDKDLQVTFTYGLFLGGMKLAHLDKTRASDVILATYSAFGEGISEKDLDTLILATPKKFIGHLKNAMKNESGKLEQIVGRIFRKVHIERHPVIVDLSDNFSVFRSQNHQRYMFYKSHFKHVIFKNYTINLDDTQDFSIIKTKNTEQLDHADSSDDIDFSKCLLD